jgi:hypothetical protein
VSLTVLGMPRSTPQEFPQVVDCTEACELVEIETVPADIRGLIAVSMKDMMLRNPYSEKMIY